MIKGQQSRARNAEMLNNKHVYVRTRTCSRGVDEIMKT